MIHLQFAKYRKEIKLQPRRGCSSGDLQFRGD